MRGAPARLGTGYDAPGHEISAAGYADSAAALDGWEHSPGHNAILTESGDWTGAHFLAIGIGLDTSYMDDIYQGRIYHVWFGEVRDPTGAPGIHGTARGDSILGTAFADWIDGHGGNDRINGAGGADRILGEGGADRLSGGAGNDRLSGGWGRDVINGGTGADRIWGGAGGDRLSGGWGRDVINGGAGRDVIHGNGGNDRLAAGPGGGRLDGGSGADRLQAGPDHDLLTGGAGADVFVFTTPGQAGRGSARDLITDFQPGLDRLDLSRMDADTTHAGNQGFELHGATLTGHPGALAFAHGVLAGDLDGDGSPDFEIALEGVASLGPHDVLL